MIIAIHQPNYLPWLGYFYKIWASDIFVLHDNVEFTKQSFTKRVFIRKSANSTEATYLSVPLKKHSDFIFIKNLKISTEQNWQKSHLNKIYNTYHRAPFFNNYYPIISKTLLDSYLTESLAELNKKLILNILNILNIDSQIVMSSDLPLSGYRADEFNAAIVAHLGGSVYISGTGAKKYQSENTYLERHIALMYNQIGKYLNSTPPQYPVHFMGNLSILDALFYIGEKEILNIFEQYFLMQQKIEKLALKFHPDVNNGD